VPGIIPVTIPDVEPLILKLGPGVYHIPPEMEVLIVVVDVSQTVEEPESNEIGLTVTVLAARQPVGSV
jgi:hypothetical protein